MQVDVKVAVSKSQPGMKKIFVGGVPLTMTAESLKELLQQFWRGTYTHK